MPKIIRLDQKQLPENCLVFKNSTSCPVSAAAAARVQQFSTAEPIYWVDVIEQRALSNWIAETYGVRHESPQLLLIKNGKVEKVFSHHWIKAENL